MEEETKLLFSGLEWCLVSANEVITLKGGKGEQPSLTAMHIELDVLI